MKIDLNTSLKNKKHENSLTKMPKPNPIINKVDQEFSEQLTKIIKSYVLDLVNHEVDVITDSDWFEEKIKTTIEESNK
mgnify:FL=1